MSAAVLAAKLIALSRDNAGAEVATAYSPELFAALACTAHSVESLESDAGLAYILHGVQWDVRLDEETGVTR